MGHNQEEHLLNPLHLINLVRNCPIIYDSTTVAFRMPDKREYAWRRIATQLNSNVKDVKKRWRSLRDRHARELKRFKNADRHPNWEFGTEMNFLNKYIKARTTHSFRSENSYQRHGGGGGGDGDGSRGDNDDDIPLTINSPNRTKLLENITSGNIQMLKAANSGLTIKTEYLNGTIDDGCEDLHQSNINNNSIDMYDDIIVEEPEEEEDRDDGDDDDDDDDAADDEEYCDDNHQGEPNQYLINEPECFIGYQYNADDNISTNNKTNNAIQTTESTIDESLQPNSQEILTTLVPDEDDHFCNAIALTIKKLSRLNNIKAKAEIYKILERLIESEENDKKLNI